MAPAIRIIRPTSSSLTLSTAVAGWSGAIGATAPTNCKIIHFVRHAQGYHNVDPGIMKEPAGLDAQLTEEGMRQCAQLAETVKDRLRPELIVTSPLTRTCQTAALSFGALLQTGVPIVALEAVRETVNFLCDARRPLSTITAELMARGVNVDVQAGCTHDHDELWASYERKHGSQVAFQAHRESADLGSLANRARSAFAWLGARPEREIVVVSHSAFYWNVLNMGRVTRGAVEDVVDYGGDIEMEGWLAARFENCECRTVVVEFL